MMCVLVLLYTAAKHHYYTTTNHMHFKSIFTLFSMHVPHNKNTLSLTNKTSLHSRRDREIQFLFLDLGQKVKFFRRGGF